MKRRRIIAAAMVLVALGAGAWWLVSRRHGAQPLRAAPAQLAIEWRGKYRGRMVLPARVNWCPVTRIGLFEAISGDSGFAIVLYEREALSGVPHPVISSDMAASAPRPGASAAIRWMRLDKDTALALFRSQTGTVRLEPSQGTVSGDITARMRAVSGTDTLVVHGVFRQVPVVTTAVGCT